MYRYLYAFIFFGPLKLEEPPEDGIKVAFDKMTADISYEQFKERVIRFTNYWNSDNSYFISHALLPGSESSYVTVIGCEGHSVNGVNCENEVEIARFLYDEGVDFMDLFGILNA